MHDDRSDEALMRAYVAGDGAAFVRLFARLAPQIHRFFVRSFRSPQVADDLLQTTFLKLHRARRDYDPQKPLRPWVFTIAARVRLDELRQRYGTNEHADEETLSRALDERGARDSRDAAASAEVVDAVRAALDRLPEAQRVVVHLHRYQGMTFGEIAAVLGTTEGAVKLRAFRAYDRLRRELAGVLEP
jgi:RNA polymerase sigma-70 factor, ECF subfamily